MGNADAGNAAEAMVEAVMPETPTPVPEIGVMKDEAPTMEIPPTASEEAPLPPSSNGVIEVDFQKGERVEEKEDQTPIEISEGDKPWNNDQLMAAAKKMAAQPRTQAEAVTGLAALMEEQAMSIREKVVTGKGAYGELGRMWAKLDAKEQDGILTEGLGFISGMLAKAKDIGKIPGKEVVDQTVDIATRSIGGRIPILKYFIVRMSKFSTEELQGYAALGILKCKNPATAAKIDRAASSKLWVASKATQLIALLTGAGAEAVPFVQMGEKAGQGLTAQLPKIRANVLAAYPEPEVEPGMVTQMKDTAVNVAGAAVNMVRGQTHDAEEAVMKRKAA